MGESVADAEARGNTFRKRQFAFSFGRPLSGSGISTLSAGPIRIAPSGNCCRSVCTWAGFAMPVRTTASRFAHGALQHLLIHMVPAHRARPRIHGLVLRREHVLPAPFPRRLGVLGGQGVWQLHVAAAFGQFLRRIKVRVSFNITSNRKRIQLAAFHICDMVIRMKTTLNISDVTMREVKREAARRQQTMSEMVEAALRRMIEPAQRDTKLPPLPEFRSGGLRVNVANRDALHDVMGA